MSGWALRLGALGLGLGLLAGAELGLARFAPVGSRMDLFPVHGVDGAVALGEVLDLDRFLDGAWVLFDRDRRLFWRLKPQLDLEASGFSLAPDAPPWHIRTGPEGRRLAASGAALVAMGDSSTFGWGVDDPASWPALAGAVNLAVPGYSSAQGLVQARAELPALAPSAVVLAFGANDGHFTPWPDHELLASRQTALGGVTWWVSGLQLVSRLRNLVYPIRMGAVMSQHQVGRTRPRVTPEELAGNLRDIAEVAGGAEVLLLDVCTRREYRKAMESLAEAQGYGMIAYEGDTLDGCHPDAAGHRWIAAAVTGALSGD